MIFLNSYYTPVFLSGALSLMLVLSLFEAVKEKPMDKKQIAVLTLALWGGVCMTLALIIIFGLTLDILEATMTIECIPCDDQVVIGILRLLLPPLL